MNKDKYDEVDLDLIMAELKKLRADDNLQVSGAYWIADALQGIGFRKRPKTDLEKIDKATFYLQKALDLIEGCDPWFNKDGQMDEFVIQRINKAYDNLKHIASSGHGEQANHRFIKALRGFFISNGLRISVGVDGSFISILEICTGLDRQTLKKVLDRMGGAEAFRENEEEKALLPLKEAADKAHEEYVRRLNENYKGKFPE